MYILDSDCTLRPRCTAGTPQFRWLRKYFEANPRRCSLAVLHHPVFSSGLHKNSSRTIELIRLLYAAGSDVVVNGNDHIYERFRRAAPWGREDPEHGMRRFIVGTGGAPLYPFRDGRPAHSQVRQNTTHGVLRLTLGEGRYAWRFLPVEGRRFTDEGETECHDPPPPRDRTSE